MTVSNRTTLCCPHRHGLLSRTPFSHFGSVGPGAAEAGVVFVVVVVVAVSLAVDGEFGRAYCCIHW